MLKPQEIQAISEYLVNQGNVELSHPYGQELSVYSVNGVEFAYLDHSKQLVSLSLRSDPRLSQVLRAKYEEVLPAHKLNPKLWNTIVMSGQLGFEEVSVLIDHSYSLAMAKTQQEN